MYTIRNIFHIGLSAFFLFQFVFSFAQKNKGFQFQEVNQDFGNTSLILPKGFQYEVLFSQNDMVIAPSMKKVPARGGHDCIVFIPDSVNPNKALLFVGHEAGSMNDELGDGGGATILSLMKIKDQWKIEGTPASVDFSTIGGTFHNCGGKITQNNHVLSAEEVLFSSNKDLIGKIRDYSSINGMSRFENYGWMLEVDPFQKKGIQKLIAMGRFSHEDALCMSDGKTVFLTNDGSPAVFYKFVADSKNDFSKGELSYYKNDFLSKWIALPRDTLSMIHAYDLALKGGATLFMRHEWITEIGGKIYISETGIDKTNFSNILLNGNQFLPYYSQKLKDGVLDDPYGRILVFNPKTNEMKVLIEGGNLDDGSVFSNPDGLASFAYGGKNYLIINEDVIGNDRGRNQDDQMICETYILDVNDSSTLKRFIVGPLGSETTGSCFSSDGKTLFISVQHPASTNPAPFNKSCVVAITGF